MHSTTRLRLQWFLHELVREENGRPRSFRLLDIGRYDDDPERHELLHDDIFEYVRLAPGLGYSGESIAAAPCKWPEFEDDSFDIVVSTHALEHIQSPWLTIREACRVLRPGGVLCVIEPAAGEKACIRIHGEERERRVSLPAFNKHPHLPDHYRFSIDALERMADDCGLRMLHKSQNLGPSPLNAEWFLASETLLAAWKPSRAEQSSRIWPCGAISPFSLSWTDAAKARLEEEKDIKEKREKEKASATPYYHAKEWKKKKTATFLGGCYATAAYLYFRTAAHDYDARHYYLTDREYFGAYYYETSLTPEMYEDSDVLFVADIPELKNATCRGGVTIRLPSFVFRGFHPDFIGPLNLPMRIRTSGIGCESYLRGYPESKALEYFCHSVYSRLGYYSAWQEDYAAQCGRFAAVSLDFDRYFSKWVREGVFMCDAVHPMDFAIVDVMKDVCEMHGIETTPGFTYNFFAYNFQNRAPVYPEIANYLGMPEVGSYNFRRTIPRLPPWRKEDNLALDEYLHALYKSLEENPKELDGFSRLEKM